MLLRCRARPEALLLTEDALQVWQCMAPRAPRPDDVNDDAIPGLLLQTPRRRAAVPAVRVGAAAAVPRAAVAALPGRRVVCCPPPQGKRPPCAEKEPNCSLTCEHQLPQKPQTYSTGPRKLCGAQRDVVAERIRCYEEHHRSVYESAVKERMARPRTPPPPLKCPQPPEKRIELATDGRMKSSPHCPTNRPPHPPPQPVTLEPLGDCRPKERSVVDPCAHTPRTLLSIDRGDPKPQTEQCQATSTPPKPCHENPKNQTESTKGSKCQTESSYKGITSRIMDTIRCGRATPAQTSPSKPKPEWCSKPPALAAAPKRCRQPTLAERMRRGSPSRNKRQFHTSATNLADKCNKDKEAPNASGREAVLAASKKLAAALSERDSLKEAGLGRAVRAPSCAPPAPPPPPRPTGGAMEFSVPADADTVCVRVSMGKRPVPQGPPVTRPTPQTPPKACPSPPCSGIPCPPQSSSDSWLSIKKLQQKISNCGRDTPASPKPSAPARPPPPCSPQGRAKMMDVLPHTIFMK
ncbi:ESX-1 secretion-associated protein EspI-like [Leguminivora glycinivorella]|uniref:ESX-1 secretion-associated protein EspI-like n=1 Tax=Leguminivora glycinivorella TaxID=1035111 RepID=UPI00200FA5B4|nr:ESX-1 secretion-associated protein EspI-like [Leguminivora glycinivorella]